jgi:hypothetical protein
VLRNLRLILLYVFASLANASCIESDPPVSVGGEKSETAVWHLDNLVNIAGHPVTVEGNPIVIGTPNGKAIEFDGIDDGIFFDVHPLAGMSTFTAEVTFSPYEGGAAEQRFFHMQENSSDERVMFETRLVDNTQWFLDTFIYSGDQKVPLYAIDSKHDTGSWYHAAIVVDGSSFKHFVNGQLELSEFLEFKAQQAGRTSLGVRLNKVNWFKGAIRTVRFTPRVLTPDEFLTAED